MLTTTCSNEECGAEIEFGPSQLEIEESQPSGNHTTQHSGFGIVKCNSCGAEKEINIVWDELNDTGEILSVD